jgi:hypothetical protein
VKRTPTPTPEDDEEYENRECNYENVRYVGGIGVRI